MYFSIRIFPCLAATCSGVCSSSFLLSTWKIFEFYMKKYLKLFLVVTCAPALTSCVTMSRCPPQLAACSAVLSQRSLRPSSSALLAVLSSAATQAGWLCWAAASITQ